MASFLTKSVSVLLRIIFYLVDEELPPIKHGNPITDRRSTFQPHLAPVVTPRQVQHGNEHNKKWYAQKDGAPTVYSLNFVPRFFHEWWILSAINNSYKIQQKYLMSGREFISETSYGSFLHANLTLWVSGNIPAYLKSFHLLWIAICIKIFTQTAVLFRGHKPNRRRAGHHFHNFIYWSGSDWFHL